MRETGTDASGNTFIALPNQLPSAGGFSCLPVATADNGPSVDANRMTVAETQENKGNDASSPQESSPDLTALSRTRTGNLLIKSQLLCRLS